MTECWGMGGGLFLKFSLLFSINIKHVLQELKVN